MSPPPRLALLSFAVALLLSASPAYVANADRAQHDVQPRHRATVRAPATDTGSALNNDTAHGRPSRSTARRASTMAGSSAIGSDPEAAKANETTHSGPWLS